MPTAEGRDLSLTYPVSISFNIWQESVDKPIRKIDLTRYSYLNLYIRANVMRKGQMDWLLLSHMSLTRVCLTAVTWPSFPLLIRSLLSLLSCAVCPPVVLVLLLVNSLMSWFSDSLGPTSIFSLVTQGSAEQAVTPTVLKLMRNISNPKITCSNKHQDDQIKHYYFVFFTVWRPLKACNTVYNMCMLVIKCVCVCVCIIQHIIYVDVTIRHCVKCTNLPPLH